MARRTKEQAEKTRTDILSAAAALFVENGVSHTSLNDIAQKAKVTRGAIYWHFKNKGDIFDALHEDLYQSFVGMIEGDLEIDHSAPLEQLKERCLQMFQDLEVDVRKRQMLTLFLIRSEYAGELEVYREDHANKKADNVKLFTQYFERARTKGVILPHADSEMLAHSVCCYMKGMVVEYLSQPESEDMQKRAPALIELFFNGLYNR